MKGSSWQLERSERRGSRARLTWSIWIVLLLLAPLPAHGESDTEVPPQAALWRSAGESFEGGSDKSAALKQYRLFVSTYGKSQRAADAQFMVGECFFAIGDYPAALAEYERVFKYAGRSETLVASAYLRMGEATYNLGIFDRSIEYLNRVVGDYAKSYLAGEALFSLGEAFIAQEKWERLEETYRHLLETRPGYADRDHVKFARGIFAYHKGDYDEAIAYLKDVESDRGVFFWGRSLEDDGQYLRAIQKFRQLLREYPGSPLADDAAFAVADAFFKAGQFQLAIEAYTSFTDMWRESPFYPNALYKLACVSFQEGRYEEAIRSLEEVRNDYADEEIRAYADFLIGNCYRELGKVPEATFAYSRIVDEFPQARIASAALHKMVWCAASEQNFAQAVLLSEDFLRRYPGDPLAGRVLMLKGFSHRQLNDHTRAIRDFQAILDKHPGTDLAERALALALITFHEVGAHDRMITTYRFLAGELLPTESVWRARSYYHLGEAYYSLGLYQDASQMYRLVLTGYPRSDVAAYALQGLTASYGKMGQYELALEEQEKFLFALTNAESEDGRNYLVVAAIHFNKRDYEEALHGYQAFLAAHPDDPEAAGALLQSGDAYYRLQYYENAIESWRTLIHRFPSDARAMDALYKIADTEFGLGHFDAAAANYQALIDRAPDSPHAADASFSIGNCYYNLRNDDAAVLAFEGFITTYPFDERVEAAERGIQACFLRSDRPIEEYLAQNPDSPLAADFLWQEGQRAFSEEHYSLAIERFKRVALDYPESESAPNAVFYLAEAHYKSEEMEAGLATFKNFAATYPNHDLAPLANFRTGAVLYRLERFAESADAFEGLMWHYGDSEYAGLAAFNVTLALAKLEEWPEYVEACKRLLEIFPEHEKRGEVMLQIAIVYQEELGDYQKAIDAYQTAVGEASDREAEINYRIGECHEKLHDTDLALQIYERAGHSGASTDPYRIAGLAEVAEIHEARRDWSKALEVYKEIATSGGKPEWKEMAEAKIAAIEAQMQ